ncbi:DUF6493 family protein [Streptomyces albipurpureus]|uniref:DUF6493 family protein n=1 Tax=Streptomyces albipurpureus TaxID=2897419 RepID=A0ABT0UWB7_9ACTN|nr:DUF6493 family protein [Streptomyces sp. CWNU-1]MCM2391643.1 DUF6493 family protein [Streptomyces sp. CWNU-1]
MNELLEAVRQGKFREVPGLVESLSPAERKECLIELKALRTEFRGADLSRWKDWRERSNAAAALLVAGTGCLSGAAAAASWLGARDLRSAADPPRNVMIDLLKGRDPDWLGDIAHRLAARASTAQGDYWLINRLVQLSGCATPTTDGYVYGWVNDLLRRSGRTHRLRTRLAEDPQTPLLVPRLFETPQLAGPLGWYSHPKNPDHWPSVLVGLVQDGVVERAVLVDGCVARLLRGGKPGDMGFFLGLLRQLELTPQEEEARIPDWIGMAADGTAQVAAEAQGVLARLAESGALPVRALAEVSGAILFRTEKKLVLAQLSLLGRVLRGHTQRRKKTKGAQGEEAAKSSAAVHELLRVIADAFGHEDLGIQERALKLVSRHLLPTDGDLRVELSAAASFLSRMHRAAAIETFGALEEEDQEEYQELLPAVPEPVRLAPATDSMAELVAELMVVVRQQRGDSGGFERALDGLVRMAHRDRESLIVELRGALADRWWMRPPMSDRRDLDNHFDKGSYGVEVALAALLGRISDKHVLGAAATPTWRSGCPYSGLIAITAARVWEVAHAVRHRPVPFLLSTPTGESGVLDPEVLIGRLREYRRLGLEPLPTDFTQALLRVSRDNGEWDPGVLVEAAAQLGTDAGDRLALWLSGDGPLLRALEPDRLDEAGGTKEVASGGLLRHPARATRRLLDRTRERLAVQREFPAGFRWLNQLPDPRHHHGYPCLSRYANWQTVVPQWPAVLPHHRDALAGWLVPGLLEATVADLHGGADIRGVSWCLPQLAEAAAPSGAAGPGMHSALAAGLGVRVADDRLAAVDALLVLAARRQLDPDLLGRQLAEYIGHGQLKPSRVTDALRTAATTGAYGTVWAILASALPRLIRSEKAARGLGALLTVAADCVERCGPQIGYRATITTDSAAVEPSAPVDAVTGCADTEPTTREPRASPSASAPTAEAAPAETAGPGGTSTARQPAGQGEVSDGQKSAPGEVTAALPWTPAPTAPPTPVHSPRAHPAMIEAEVSANGPTDAVRIPGLAELADRGGSSQLVKQAARLMAALR